MSDPHICAECHQEGHGCCVLGLEGADKQFGLTSGEIDEMCRAGGLQPSDFLMEDVASQEFLDFVDQIHPVLRKTMPGGRRQRLKVDKKGRCVLLGARGCRLPIAARPLYCRMYPFWFTPGGRLTVLISKTCLAQKGALSWRDVLTRMNEEEERLRFLFERLEVLAAKHEAGS
jgi:Fe-S-cluster containining protein